MNSKNLLHAKDPDLRASMAAMQRAAAEARKIAIATGTGIIVGQDGKVVRIPAKQLIKEQQENGNKD